MRVIMLTGPKRSGKNALADAIGDHLESGGVALRQVAFADPMRWAVDAIGLPRRSTREDKDLPCAELGGKPGRDLLLALGALARGMSPSFWVDHMIRRLDALEVEDPSPVIVTDARFANELGALLTWAAARPDRHLAPLWVERPGAAEDEVLDPMLRNRCVVVRNAGGLGDLRVRAIGISDWAAGYAGPEILWGVR